MIKLILILLFLSIAGCTHSQLVKQCQPVQDSEQFACKTLKPWE